MEFAPSAETNPYWCAYFIVLLSSVLFFFLTKSDSDAQRLAKKKRREVIQEGLRLLLAEVEKGDEKDGTEREKGLPEAARVLSYLYDEISEQPTTSLGIPASYPDFAAARKLLNRTLRLQVRKTLTFTKKAIEVQELKTRETSAGGIPPTPKQAKGKTRLLGEDPPPPMLDLNRAKSWEVTPAERNLNEWLKGNDTSKKELALYLSGEKLEATAKMGKQIRDVLGDRALEADTKDMLKDCEVLMQAFRRSKRASAEPIMALVREAAPRWIFALIIVQIHPLMWFEYDRIVSGKALYASLRKDGTWDQEMSLQKVIDVFVMCGVWHFTNGVGDIIIESAKRKFCTSLKARFCECLMFQDYEYFEINGVGALQSRLNQDVEEVAQSLLSLPFMFCRTTLGLMSSFIYVFYIVPWDLAAIAFVPLLIIAPINNQLQRFNRRRGERLRKMTEHASSGTMDALINIDVVRGFATEKSEIWRYTQNISIQAELASQTDMVTRIAGPLCAFLFTANLGFLSYFAAMKVANKEMLIDDCGVFLIQIGLHAQGRVMHLLDLVPQLLKMLNPLYRLVDHLNAQPKIEPHPSNPLTRPFHVTVATEKALEEAVANLEDMNYDASVATKRFARMRVAVMSDTGDRIEAGSRVVACVVHSGQELPLFRAADLRHHALPVKLVFSQGLMPKIFEGNIEFRNVRFTYPRDLRKPIYTGVSYCVNRGQKIGICGSTGCGKSTGFGLLQRFYDVDPGDGMILIDGVDIREYDVHYLRQRIAMVSQKCVLFKTTVRENILYGMNSFADDAAGKEEADKAVIAALKLAQAWDFINDTPDKLLTPISETGGGFSGGQKQRLCIARVLIRKPDVILLDEATSALDPEAERAVQNTLDEVMRDYTVIAVAHRLTTIKDSDKIIVLNEGNVVEEGPHDELLKKELVYSDDDDGKRKLTSGFYRNQWEAQFKQKELTNDKLRARIECLQQEIGIHEAKIERTRSLIATWRKHSWNIGKRRLDSFEDVDDLNPGSFGIPHE